VPEVFHYCVKIISSAVGKNIVRQVHDFKGKFSSVPAMMEKFADHLPYDINFTLSYLEGKQSKKRWLYCKEDLEAMYKVFKVGDEITLWCEKNSMKRKRADDVSTSKQQDKEEEEVHSTYQSLKEKHVANMITPN